MPTRSAMQRSGFSPHIVRIVERRVRDNLLCFPASGVGGVYENRTHVLLIVTFIIKMTTNNENLYTPSLCLPHPFYAFRNLWSRGKITPCGGRLFTATNPNVFQTRHIPKPIGLPPPHKRITNSITYNLILDKSASIIYN